MARRSTHCATSLLLSMPVVVSLRAATGLKTTDTLHFSTRFTIAETESLKDIGGSRGSPPAAAASLPTAHSHRDPLSPICS